MSENLVGKIIQKLFNNYGKLLIIPIPSQLNKLLSGWVNSKRFWTLWTSDIIISFCIVLWMWL